MSEIKGKIVALCISEARGTVKHAVEKAKLIKGNGIEGDAHAGHWHRQVSLLAIEQVESFNQRIAASNAQILARAVEGTFGENILVRGIDLRKLPVGTLLKAGNVVLKLSQIGKECHKECAIRRQVGDCVMPREGVLAIVLKEGIIGAGDEIRIETD